MYLVIDRYFNGVGDEGIT